MKLEDIKSNCVAKRALEVAAAGDHSIMLFGPLGAGKTTLRECFPDVDTREMELCSCGNTLSVKLCVCNETIRGRYLRHFVRRAAGMDMVVEVNHIPVREMQSNYPGVTAAQVKTRVSAAKAFGTLHTSLELDDAGTRIMEMAARRLTFTAGQYAAAVRVGRTIANLSGSARIGAKHVAEAVQYRGDLYIDTSLAGAA